MLSLFALDMVLLFDSVVVVVLLFLVVLWDKEAVEMFLRSLCLVLYKTEKDNEIQNTT